MKKLEAECLWTHLSENKKKKKKRKEGRKESKKEEKERKCVWFYSVGYRQETFFFPITAFNCALSNPFSFPLITSWTVINAQSS